ncbi:hypothetical protein AOLI_G00121790 [Acnodon oligacanthus]
MKRDKDSDLKPESEGHHINMTARSTRKNEVLKVSITIYPDAQFYSLANTSLQKKGFRNRSVIHHSTKGNSIN